MSAVYGGRAWYEPCVAENSRHNAQNQPEQRNSHTGAAQAEIPGQNELQEPGTASDASHTVHSEEIGWRVQNEERTGAERPTAALVAQGAGLRTAARPTEDQNPGEVDHFAQTARGNFLQVL